MNDNHFDLRQAHPEVRRMKQLLDPAFKDSTGLLNGMRKHKVLRVKVSKEQVNRALCIMDALIRALEKRGAKFVKVEQSDQREIRIDEERIECLLIEETRRTERVTDDPNPLAWRLDRWQWHATGQLRFEIQEYTGKGGKQKWADSKRRTLEKQLGKIVEGLFACAKNLKQLAIERAERKRQWQEERRQQEAAAQKEMLELNRRKNLEEKAQQWARSINLDAFINACEKQMIDGSPAGIASDSWETKWLGWARAHAERLSPLRNGFLEDQKRAECATLAGTP
jgi:hypothetical protein